MWEFFYPMWKSKRQSKDIWYFTSSAIYVSIYSENFDGWSFNTVPIRSRIIESTAYCYLKLLVHLYLNSTQNTSVNKIIWLLLSLIRWPKAILLNGGHCTWINSSLSVSQLEKFGLICCIRFFTRYGFIMWRETWSRKFYIEDANLLCQKLLPYLEKLCWL